MGFLDMIFDRRVTPRIETTTQPIALNQEYSDSKEVITADSYSEPNTEQQRPPIVFWNGG